MKKLLALILVAMFPAVAFGDDTDDKIAMYDQNDDGMLSQQEVAADEEISAQFEKLDANGDALLDDDELDKGPLDDFDEIGDDPVDE